MGFLNQFRKYFFGNVSEEEYLKKRGMKVGNNCHIYSWATIDHTYPHLISIGNDVTISTNVTILSHDASTNVVKCGTKVGKVRIGNNVFIGTGAIILCNVKIGDNVVIGAGSVVTKDLPSNAVYAGQPAKMVATIEDYRERTENLREKCPDIGKIRQWNQWADASDEDRLRMNEALGDSVGFI